MIPDRSPSSPDLFGLEKFAPEQFAAEQFGPERPPSAGSSNSETPLLGADGLKDVLIKEATSVHRRADMSKSGLE